MSDTGLNALGTTPAATNPLRPSTLGGAVGTSRADGNGFTSEAMSGLDKDAFLQLLVAQMKYQNPMSPMDSNQFLQQAAQYASVEQLENVATGQEEVRQMQMVAVATNLVGREVTAVSQLTGEEITGPVTTVRFGTEPILIVGGAEIPLSEVIQVHNVTNGGTVTPPVSGSGTGTPAPGAPTVNPASGAATGGSTAAGGSGGSVPPGAPAVPAPATPPVPATVPVPAAVPAPATLPDPATVPAPAAEPVPVGGPAVVPVPAGGPVPSGTPPVVFDPDHSGVASVPPPAAVPTLVFDPTTSGPASLQTSSAGPAAVSFAAAAAPLSLRSDVPAVDSVAASDGANGVPSSLGARKPARVGDLLPIGPTPGVGPQTMAPGDTRAQSAPDLRRMAYDQAIALR